MKVKQKKISAEIFTGSMADISFLIIIYFMLTSVLSSTRGLDFDLPDDDPTQVELEPEDAIDIYVTADGSIQIDKKPATLAEVLPYVKKKLEQNRKKPVILRTHPEANFQAMVSVFDELRQSKERIGFEIEQISVPTQREIENTLMQFF